MRKNYLYPQKRQKVETTPWVVELSLRNALRQIANEAKYKLYEKYMYEYGSSDAFFTIAAKHQEWIAEYNTTSDTRVIGGKVISYDKGQFCRFQQCFAYITLAYIRL